MRYIVGDFAALSLLGALGLSYGCGNNQSGDAAGAGAPSATAGASANGGAGAVAGADATSGSAGILNASGGSGAGGAGDAGDAGAANMPEPMPGPKRCAEETEVGALTASTGARVVKTGGASPGKTAALVGYSATGIVAGTNAVLWARYTGAQTFRTFGSVQPEHGKTDPAFGDGITSEAQFNVARDALSAAGSKSTLVPWKNISAAIASGKAGGVLPMANAVNAPAVVEIKTTILSVPLDPGTGATQWKQRWEVWKNYFALSFLYARDYGAAKFEIYNEPDLKIDAMDPLPDYTIRAELAGDAIQLGVQAANSARKAIDPAAVALAPIVIAPTTATMSTPPGHVEYGNLIVSLLHTGPLGAPAAPPYTLWQGYGYHSYNSDGAGSFDNVTKLYNAVLAGKLQNTPWYITEFNALTNMDSDTLAKTLPDGEKTYVADLPDFSRRLVEKAIGYTEANVGPMNLFAFNFLSEPDSPTQYSNNGLHWSDNSVIGGDSAAAAAYRLLIQHFGSGRDQLGLVVGADPADGTKAATTLFEATYDERADAYFIIASNRATSQKKVFLDLSSLKLPSGLTATVSDVDAKHHGEITHRIALSAQSTFEITQEPNAITLVSVPRSVGTVTGLGAVADATLAPGAQSTTRFGDKPTLDLAADSTAASKLRTAFIAFELPALTKQSIGEAILDLSLTAGSKPSSDVIHVYGIADKGLTDDATTGATWGDIPNLHELADSAKYATISDNAIAYNIGSKLDPDLRLVGTGIASGGLLRIDASNYIREQAAFGHTRVSLLLVREVNHHVETISYAASLNSRESSCGGPALLLRTFDTPK